MFFNKKALFLKAKLYECTYISKFTNGCTMSTRLYFYTYISMRIYVYIYVPVYMFTGGNHHRGSFILETSFHLK